MGKHSNSSLSIFLLLLLLLLLTSILNSQSTNSSLPDSEVSALDTIASKLNMKSPRYYFYRSCADFYDGIDCNCSYESYTVCHVTSLSLQNHHLSGQVPRELADLPYLEVIELSGNQLYGLIPESLGNLSKLVTLDLSSNLLFGSIPERLGNMQSLKTLNLFDNFLNGSIPPALGALSSLESLSLGPNRLSGPIPNELGNITTLQYLGLRDNNLSGDLPQGLGSLRNLESFLILSNNVTGELPRTFADLTSLRVFSVIGNSLSGRIPDFIQNWTQLNSLTIMGNNFEGPLNISTLARLKELWVSDLRSSQILFPPLSNLKKLKSLILRNCSITGQIPAYIGNFQSLRYLDLSFNNLTGEIPNSISTLSLTNAYFTRNMLNGSIPGSFPQSLRTYWDFSYNSFSNVNFTGPNNNTYVNLFACCSPTTFNTTSPLKIMNEYCPGSKMSKYNSLYINCGGEGITIDGNYYEEDDQTSDSYVSPNGNWAYSRSGYVIGTDSRPKDYIRNMKCGIPMPDTSLYATSRLSPLSLKYHGLCLQNGNYKVKLHFAETLYKDNKDYSILGKRIFDVYIQGNRVLKDFNIIDESKDPNKVVIKEFLAVVMNHTLEIHFYWAGKGSIYIPPYLYGPLISAISVIPDFELHKRGVSTFAKTTIAVSSFALLLFVSVSTWKMSGLEQKKLDGNVPINIGGTSVTFKDIVQATQNFSPKMEIGGGDFGTVYKAEMKEKGITIVKKLSPNLKQGINEIKNEINSFSSLKHENLVQTLGAFSGDNQNLLLNEYMENDSLSRALFDPQSSLQLSWPIRYNMCLGIAKGLNYLHQDSRMKIVHRGIKATNILLDKFLKAKISDFGLAKLFDGDGIPMPTRGGRRGYMAPEYATRGVVTPKADVYSFGVLTLEIISGKNTAEEEPNEESDSLLDTAIVYHKNGNILDLVDESVRYGTDYSEEQAKTLLNLAILCTHQSLKLRPTMSEVVSVLEEKKTIAQVSTTRPHSRPKASNVVGGTKALRDQNLCTEIPNTSTQVTSSTFPSYLSGTYIDESKFGSVDPLEEISDDTAVSVLEGKKTVAQVSTTRPGSHSKASNVGGGTKALPDQNLSTEISNTATQVTSSTFNSFLSGTFIDESKFGYVDPLEEISDETVVGVLEGKKTKAQVSTTRPCSHPKVSNVSGGTKALCDQNLSTEIPDTATQVTSSTFNSFLSGTYIDESKFGSVDPLEEISDETMVSVLEGKKTIAQVSTARPRSHPKASNVSGGTKALRDQNLFTEIANTSTPVTSSTFHSFLSGADIDESKFGSVDPLEEISDETAVSVLEGKKTVAQVSTTRPRSHPKASNVSGGTKALRDQNLSTEIANKSTQLTSSPFPSYLSGTDIDEKKIGSVDPIEEISDEIAVDQP